MKVSICLAVYNGEQSIQDAICSIKNQTYNDWEIIIIDDCSTDRTHEIIESIQDEKFRIFRNKSRMGLAYSLNRAVSLAKGKYIARMDADDICYPDRLYLQVKYMEENPEIVLVGGQAIMFRGDREIVGIMMAPLKHDDICKNVASSIPLFHPCWLGKAKWFKENSYDEKFKKAQDYEKLVRDADTCKYGNLPDVVLGYRYESENLKKRIMTRYYMLKALNKNSGTFSMLFFYGVIVQCIKLLIDLVVFGFKLNRKVERQKFKFPDDKTVILWKKILEQLDRCVE